jgi:hypothetical protein
MRRIEFPPSGGLKYDGLQRYPVKGPENRIGTDGA